MPFFKTTYNILVRPWEDELFDPNWMDSDKIKLPPNTKWDYSRELQIEDVHIWEVLYEASGGIGIYAAWDPFAEFYMFTVGWKPNTINDRIIETYYGPKASENVKKRADSLGLNLQLHKIWVEPEDMWLYQ
jgi:hypothetical protein